MPWPCTIACPVCSGLGGQSFAGVIVGICGQCHGSGQCRCNVCGGAGEVDPEATLRCTRCGNSVPPPAGGQQVMRLLLLVRPAERIRIMGRCEKGDRLRPGFCLVINEAHVQRSVSRRPARWPEPGASSNGIEFFEPPSYELLGEYWHQDGQWAWHPSNKKTNDAK